MGDFVSTSESDSEFEANVRRTCKRPLSSSESSDSSFGPESHARRTKRPLSSSESSSSSFGPRIRVSRRKRARLLTTSIVSETDDSNSDADMCSDSPSTRPGVIPASSSTQLRSSNATRLSWRRQNNSPMTSTQPMPVQSFVIQDSEECESDNAPPSPIVTPPLARTAASARSLAASHSKTVCNQPRSPSNEFSDSGDESAEKCAVCLRCIKTQEVGSPEGCDHTFCLECIVQWSKSCNRCPLDRQPFTIILVRENIRGQVVRQLAVEERALPIDVEDTIFCLICGGFDREDRMLLCDGCDRGFHLDCLNPPLANIPEVEEWFCPTCVAWDQVTADMASRAAGVDMRENPRTARNETPPRPIRRRLATTARGEALSARIFMRVQRTLESARGRFSFFQPSTLPSLDTPPAEDQPSTSGTRSSRRAPTQRKTKKKITKRKKRTTTRRKYTIKKKKIFVENEDGTVTEETVSVRTKIVHRRRRKKKAAKKKPRATSRRSSRPVPAATGRSVRGRLARTLGVIAPSTPGQLVPEVCSRRSTAPAVGVNLSRAMAGIPTLHIFGPRDELAPVSSGSDTEVVGEGGVGLLSRGRVGMSTRPLERRKAIELLQSAPATRSRLLQPCQGPADLLSSILESQALWHSKNSEVTVRNDGTVQLLPKTRIDLRNAGAERATAAAPVYPTSSSQTGGYRPQLGSTSSSAVTGPGASQAAASSTTASRFGAPRNDREGYTNYLNAMPASPAPFCRGGPPLRFRMPVRPQLRRIPLLPRRIPRALYDEEEGDDDVEEPEKVVEEVEKEPKPSEEDIDLYSDIEPNTAEREGDSSDRGGAGYPALGPPPEPPAFLLSLGKGDENKTESNVYDPAEPCDSDEEMVIDESNQPQGDVVRVITGEVPPLPPTPSLALSPPRTSNDDECPVLRLYSSDSVEYSRKGEEERARDLADSKFKRQQQSPVALKSPPSSPKERTGARLSFNVDSSSHDDSQDSITSLPGNRERSSPDSHVEDAAAVSVVPTESLQSPISSPSEVGSTHSPQSGKSAPSRGDRNRKLSAHSGGGSRSPVSVGTSSARAGQRRISFSSQRSSCSPVRDRPRVSRSRRSSFPSHHSNNSPDADEDVANLINSSGATNDNSSPLQLSADIPRVSTGLEGLDVEEVSSEMEENDFNPDDGHLSSLSLSGLSNRSKRSSPAQSKRKKRKKKRPKEKGKSKCASEEGEIDSDKDNPKKSDKRDGNIGDENKSDGDRKKKKRSKSVSPGRKILSSKENKKTNKEDKDSSWKKPSKKDKNYREGRKSSKERSRSKDRRRSRSGSPKRDKKKSKEKKKSEKEKKKEIERYDVRKIVKNKEVRKKDAFGRDLPSKSLSLSHSPSRSKSRSRSRARGRPPARRASRSPSPSSARGFRRGRRRYRSHSRSPQSPRRPRKVQKSPARDGRKSSRSRLRRSRSRRRSVSRSPRLMRNERPAKKTARPRKSWSRSLSLSSAPRSPSPPRVRPDFSPMRVLRSISPARIRHSFSRSWSRGQSLTRGPSLEKLTVVLTAKDKKKKKKRKEDKRVKNVESKKKKSGNSKEVFASGDNVLVSVNFNRTNKSGSTPIVVPAVSPVSKKKKRGAPEETDRAVKKSKTSTSVSKTVVDAALASQGAGTKRKKLTRLTEADAEVILNRKPVAVIDLDMSPYREQTPSPVNVVVVSDSGSGEEGKAPTPTPQRARSPDIVILPATTLAAPSASYSLAPSGPKTPPEPPLKFSISKPALLRPMANPLADGDDGDEEPSESLDGRTESTLDQGAEGQHKGPNTPPEPRGPSTPPRGPSTPPRGPSTPKSPPSPQTSPDAYDPFEPTKSGSPSPMGEQEGAGTDSSTVADSGDKNGHGPVASVSQDDSSKNNDHADGISPEVQFETIDLEATPTKEAPTPTVEIIELTPSQVVMHGKNAGVVARKSTPQPMTPSTGSTLPLFSLPSPNKTSNRPQSATAGLAVSGIQRLQHRLGSPVNKTPNSVKSTPEKRGPELLSTGNFKIRNAAKRNGPLQDATNETVEMDDSPYSPASSEGDDLFDPPPALQAPTSAPATTTPYKPAKPKTTPVKAANKFELLFGASGPTLSPLKNGGKKPPKAIKPSAPKSSAGKTPKKTGGKKGVALKMDEDQLRILDEVPSSAVELQVKDKFLKKLNRQERVVDEVKTVLKPHYARKHITKEQYKDILRRAVPKICHSKSGEINPSKIQQLVEAYVRKYRHNKKKGTGGVQKPKLKKTTMFS